MHAKPQNQKDKSSSELDNLAFSCKPTNNSKASNYALRRVINSLNDLSSEPMKSPAKFLTIARHSWYCTESG